MVEIGQVLEYLPGKGTMLRDPNSALLAPVTAYADNAHVNCLLRLPERYRDQPFSIFQGSVRSLRFPYAVPVTSDLCRACFTDKDGQPFDAT